MAQDGLENKNNNLNPYRIKLIIQIPMKLDKDD